MQLYRPVGAAELRLVVEGDFKAFPPRLPRQPIFYPVLDLEYAEQIARDWNTKDAASGYAGFVTSFVVSDEVAQRYPVKTVGATKHRELWVPAVELEDFNRGIESDIEVVRHFLGAQFTGRLDPLTHLPVPAEKDAPETHAGWTVCRLDDNGNEFVMKQGLELEAALHAVSEYEARGHKQSYWASGSTEPRHSRLIRPRVPDCEPGS